MPAKNQPPKTQTVSANSGRWCSRAPDANRCGARCRSQQQDGRFANWRKGSERSWECSVPPVNPDLYQPYASSDRATYLSLASLLEAI
jgi:hypothetical protein